jgi:hypothetical protein
MGSGGDEYEKQFMAAGAAIARSRVRMPGWFFAVLGLPLLALLIVGITTLQPSVLGVLALELPLMLAIGLVFSHLRATVTATHLHVQYGLWGPKVPLERIERVALEEYDWKTYGGWGLRRARNGTWAYSVPGSGTTMLRVDHRGDDGKLKSFIVSVDDPAAMLLAIEKARASVGRGVRVANEADAPGASASSEESGVAVANAESSPDAGSRSRGDH